MWLKFHRNWILFLWSGIFSCMFIGGIKWVPQRCCRLKSCFRNYSSNSVFFFFLTISILKKWLHSEWKLKNVTVFLGLMLSMCSTLWRTYLLLLAASVLSPLAAAEFFYCSIKKPFYRAFFACGSINSTEFHRVGNGIALLTVSRATIKKFLRQVWCWC